MNNRINWPSNSIRVT
uniref:Uncharacterized protein n=1 Tax=Rhizophora mucronata TaxID=61149 RepID=A0A2P2QVY6_RHIMU